MKIERILVGCGLGEGENEVWKTALGVGKVYGSQVLPVHVHGGDGLLGGSSESEEFAQARLEALATQGREAGVEIAPPEVLHGKPAEQLLKRAESWGASWVVIGAAERSGWERLLGASAEQLCRESKLPTLLVPPGGHPQWTHVLCAVDGSKPARAALGLALEMSRNFTAQLTLLYVETEDEAKREAADEVMRSMGMHEVEVDVLTRKGESVPAVIAAAREETGADLLVMGTAGRTGLGRILRPNTAEALLRNLTCPLLVAPA